MKRFRLAYQARQSAPPTPNLLMAPFGVARPDQIWVADIAFIATRSEWSRRLLPASEDSRGLLELM